MGIQAKHPDSWPCRTRPIANNRVICGTGSVSPVPKREKVGVAEHKAVTVRLSRCAVALRQDRAAFAANLGRSCSGLDQLQCLVPFPRGNECQLRWRLRIQGPAIPGSAPTASRRQPKLAARNLVVADPIDFKNPVDNGLRPIARDAWSHLVALLGGDEIGQTSLNFVQVRLPGEMSPQQDSSSLLKSAYHRIRLNSDSHLQPFRCCLRTPLPPFWRSVGFPKRALRRLPVFRRTSRLRSW